MIIISKFNEKWTWADYRKRSNDNKWTTNSGIIEVRANRGVDGNTWNKGVLP